jgi:hypothetical protein
VVFVVAGCASDNQAERGEAEERAQAQKADREKQAEQAQQQQKAEQKAGEMQEDSKAKRAQKMRKMMQKMMEMDKAEMPSDKGVRATVTQPEGKVTYWVTPGPRKLDTYFGTKEDPKLTAQPPDDAPKPTKKLIRDMPILIGVPEEARTYEDGEAYTEMPTPFGNDGVPVEASSLDLTYIDRQSEDTKGPPIRTSDEVEADIQFTDPQGNSYELNPKLVVQPPIPGYNTQGGVVTDAAHHGTTGTGSPLMPEVYSWGAMWAVGDVVVNGEVADQNQMMHCMTTETVRNKNYELAMQEDLPLDEDETIAGQMHHTHCIVLPVKMTPGGPQHHPVETAFELPDGEMQPFIHIMYENDQLGDGLEWGGPTGEE